MFKNVLIANRGEIACRIIRTAKRLGITTITIYSDADSDALHVHSADSACLVKGRTPVASYLNIDEIIRVAWTCGAEAIHPGYGFLAENPDFADAVRSNGMEFIGPSSDAIRMMGAKNEAKQTMASCGIPVVSGYHGEDQSEETLNHQAECIGFPLLIKASSGGGGRGMCLVDSHSEFLSALQSVRSEAMIAFGQDHVILESYISKSRHIEVQIFGDKYGNIVHLFERDCSIQRRNQKIIEESPAPGITREIRTRITDIAIKAARSIGYYGAGTIEFIADCRDGLNADRIWFMEMNTRLQVEHPVTELVTGIDLVEWQLRVAAGGTLPVKQEELVIVGHAIEARLCAENVGHGFIATSGQVNQLHFPDNCRVDSGIRDWEVISPNFDPMIAKIISHGATRKEACQNLVEGLAATKISGVATNLHLLSAIICNQEFCNGRLSTDFLEKEFGTTDFSADPSLSTMAIAIAIWLQNWQSLTWQAGFNLWSQSFRYIYMKCRNKIYRVLYRIVDDSSVIVKLDAEIVRCQICDDIIYLNEKQVTVTYFQDKACISIFWNGIWEIEVFDYIAGSSGSNGSGTSIKAPIPGLIRELNLNPGKVTQQGEKVATIEAMKMEHSIIAQRKGKIKEVLVTIGDQIDGGAVIATFEQSQEPSTESIGE